MKNRALWFLAGLAILLAVGIFARHDSSFSLAEITGRDYRVIFHIAGGLLEVELLAIILALLYVLEPLAPTDRHTKFWLQFAQLMCVIGIVEASLLSGCSLFMTTEPATGTVCRHVTALPIGYAIKGVELFVIVAHVAAYIGPLIWSLILNWWRGNGNGS